MNTLTEQRNLHFDSIDDLIAEVKHLRHNNYSRAGAWSLAQICRHLTVALQALMRPGPHLPNTPEQDAKRPLLESIFVNGKIPKGIEAPSHAVPADSSGDAEIDAFFQTLETFKNFPGPFAPHYRFGNLSNEQMQKLQLIHAAHHLSHLIPAI
jgi:hypothetical protein